MAGLRRAWIDRAPGETRGVVTLDGRPERLLIERQEDPPGLGWGARSVGRVAAVERGLRSAFVDLADGEVVASLTESSLQGAFVELVILTESRRDKRATARIMGPAQGPLRLLEPGPDLRTRLLDWTGETPETGDAAREVADLAQEHALAVEYLLPGGGSVSVERTRGLVAVDVDVAGAALGRDARRAMSRVNAVALHEAARLIRLKGLGGPVVIDLAGGARDGEKLQAVARQAFEPDGSGVVHGPLSRLGLLQLSRPWRETPALDRLLDGDRLSLRTRGSDLLRAAQREGAAMPGALLELRAAPALAEVVQPFIAGLGPRFSLRAEVGRQLDHPDIRRR